MKTSSADIRIIGSRSSGKTTYLSALLRFPEALRRQFPKLAIEPKTDHAEQLIADAKNILEQGAQLPGTDLRDGAEPTFHFEIRIPATKHNRPATIDIVAKDYAGEVFESAAQPHRQSFLKPYLEDWLTAQGWLIMLTDWQLDKDERLYYPALKTLLTELRDRAQVNAHLNTLKIAVVMSKCERGELWACRLDPEEDLFKVRLPQTHRFLREQLPNAQVKFFACSAFGILSDRLGDRDPRPNRYLPQNGSAEYNAYLRDASAWQPYGLIAPLYWLSTGKTLYDERL